MSGILGIWNVDGEPVQKELLASMSAQMAHRGPDGESLWIQSNVGFACQVLRITPESRAEDQPVVSTSGCALLFDGRLDNRKELIAQLPPSAAVRAQAPDSALVMEAYCHFGDRFVKEIDGEFALAVFDPVKRKLSLARDIMATRPLYYCQFGHCVLFATEIKSMLAHPAMHTRPNRAVLAEYLFRAFTYADETATFFEDISAVPPGHLVQIDSGGVRMERFWDFDNSRKVRFRSTNEYVEAYRHCFENAVKKRIRSSHPAAVTVSGGLDSSSIFCVAQELHRKEPGIPEVIGIALVSDLPETNESAYQRVIEEKYGIEIVKFPLLSTSIGTVPRQTWHTEAPFQQGEAWYQLFSEARSRGVRTVCSGFFGDQILQNPQYVLDLALGLRWPTALHHLEKYYGWQGDQYPRSMSTKDLLSYVKGYLIPEMIRPLYQWYKRKFLMKPPAFPGYSEEFVQFAYSQERKTVALKFAPGSAHSKVVYSQARSRHHSIRMGRESNFSAMLQLEVNYPFRDRDLISLVMAFPGEIVNLDGTPRGIHRAAMKGILPELIENRIGKAAFTSIASAGARLDLKSFKDRLPWGLAGQLGFLKRGQELTADLTLMEQKLASPTTGIYGWLVEDIIALESWLQTFFSGKSD